jgi:hypothetical protein
MSDTITIIAAILSVIATAGAAYAAWQSYKVSSRSFNFQKQLVKNQHKAVQFQTAINDLTRLNCLTKYPITKPDEMLENNQADVEHVLHQLEILGETTEFPYQDLAISRCQTMDDMVIKNAIDPAMSELEKHSAKLWD